MLHCIVVYHVDIDASATTTYELDADPGQEPEAYQEEVVVADQAQDQDSANCSQDQGKPRCINPNLKYAMLYICVCAFKFIRSCSKSSCIEYVT